MSAAGTPMPIDTLEPLLEVLLDLLHEDVPDASVRAAVREAQGDWTEILTSTLPAVGLQVRWLAGGLDVVREEARPDFPLVTWDSGPGGGWSVVRSRTFGRTEIVRVGSARQQIKRSPLRVFGVGERQWARIVPLLPVSALHPKPATSPLGRLISLVRAERQDIAVVVLMALGIGLFSLATPLAIQLLINWLAFGALLQPIITLGVALLLCLTFVATLRAAQRQAVEVVQRRVFVRLVTDVSARLARVRLDAFDGMSGPELANRFFDVITLQKALSTLLLDGLAAALTALVGAVLLAFYHPALLAFDAVAVVLVAMALIPLGRGAQYTAVVESKKKYAVAAWLEEIAGNPVALRMGGARLAEQSADRLAHAWLKARENHFRVYFRQYVGLQVVVVVLPVLLLVLTGWLVLEGQLTLGQLVAAEFIVTSALTGILKFTEKLETVYDLLAGIDKVGALLDLPLEPTSGAGSIAEGPARVEVVDVKAGFPGRPPILDGLTVELKPGQRIGVLTGEGPDASLLSEVVLGLRRPSAGTVCRDGVPSESVRPAVLHEEAMLLRADAVFAGTIRQNLVLGSPLGDAKLWAVLERLGLESVVRTLPEHLDTVLLPNGSPLSTTEQAGILVARAVLLRPRLLVVDGLLDSVPPDNRERWLAEVTRNPAWTLLLTSTQPKIVAGLPARFTLTGGQLHE